MTCCSLLFHTTATSFTFNKTQIQFFLSTFSQINRLTLQLKLSSRARLQYFTKNSLILLLMASYLQQNLLKMRDTSVRNNNCLNTDVTVSFDTPICPHIRTHIQLFCVHVSTNTSARSVVLRRCIHKHKRTFSCDAFVWHKFKRTISWNAPIHSQSNGDQLPLLCAAHVVCGVVESAMHYVHRFWWIFSSIAINKY